LVSTLLWQAHLPSWVSGFFVQLSLPVIQVSQYLQV
jgi:hypothetical protein